MVLEHVHVEAVGGVAGDMLLAALIDLGAPESEVARALESAGEPGLRLTVERVIVGGVSARYVRSLPAEREAGGHHAHRHLSDVLAVVERAQASEAARARARRVFEILAAAEAEVHGGTPGEVHLHEVGGVLDSILDVLGIAVALDLLGNPSLSSSPLPSGRGSVMTSHGRLDCPVPAVVAISGRHGIELAPAPELTGETVTPTGIAVLAEAVRGGSGRDASGADQSGVGAGTRRFDAVPNIVRLHGWIRR